MKSVEKTLGTLVFLFFALAGCGGGGGAQVGSNKKVSQLSVDEVQQLQQQIRDELKPENEDDILQGVCLYYGVTLASVDDSTSCEQEMQNCLTESAAEPEGAGADEAEFAELAKNCDATVEEVLTCISDTVQGFAAVAKGRSCSTSASEIQAAVTTPASCGFTDRCRLAEEYASQLDDLTSELPQQP